MIKMKQKTKEINLKGGAVVTIPVSFKYAKCRSCVATDIIWATTKNGKSMPIRWSEKEKGFISHFADCPNAGEFRKKVLKNLKEKK